MSLTAATITVYFIGLVNFHQAEGQPLEALLPLTTPAEAAMRAEESLPVHHVNIVITGLAAGSTCTSLGGDWSGESDKICTVKVPDGATITLPRSSAALTRVEPFGSLPRLKTTLCSSITGLKGTNQYAARVSLPTGQLGACKSGRSWISRLTLTGTSDAFRIGDKSAILDTGAIVYLMHAPARSSAGSSDEQHFRWYYTMYAGAERCTALPSISGDDFKCDAAVRATAHRHGDPFASGVGCTNTVYP